jgi:hypothetical protein
LLIHWPAHHWEDLRTIDGKLYATYQEAARAFGLFSDNNEGLLAFWELMEFGATPAQLLGIWLSITQITFFFYILLLKHFSLFLGNGICLEMVFQLFIVLPWSRPMFFK